MNTMKVISVGLVYEPHTTSILLGYEIGTAELPHGRKMRVTGSGNTIRFRVDGIDGNVDLKLGDIAKEAAILLTDVVE